MRGWWGTKVELGSCGSAGHLVCFCNVLVDGGGCAWVARNRLLIRAWVGDHGVVRVLSLTAVLSSFGAHVFVCWVHDGGTVGGSGGSDAAAARGVALWLWFGVLLLLLLSWLVVVEAVAALVVKLHDDGNDGREGSEGRNDKGSPRHHVCCIATVWRWGSGSWGRSWGGGVFRQDNASRTIEINRSKATHVFFFFFCFFFACLMNEMGHLIHLKLRDDNGRFQMTPFRMRGVCFT